ncbi:hypothetical protein FNAPI_13581 [Fusarium napiforme]|uniref:Uncharacterized protein n=1 Tax=Fusarium napiforme TaxID=42672 RepID=A0A8H5I6A2_9HYPO|nr:hypothetical protein FNAPI_13581 [Fusarium napiforme]
MAPPTTQEDTDYWGKPKPDNLTKGWNVSKSGGATTAWPEPDPLISGWQLLSNMHKRRRSRAAKPNGNRTLGRKEPVYGGLSLLTSVLAWD